MTPMERAARALASGLGHEQIDKDWMSQGLSQERKEAIVQQQVDRVWPRYAPLAGLVLSAIREPSEAMARAGASDVGNGWQGPHSECAALHGCTSVYSAMIDAALEEG